MTTETKTKRRPPAPQGARNGSLAKSPTSRQQAVFDALCGGDESLRVEALTDAILRSGLGLDDPRLSRCMARIRSAAEHGDRLSLEEFVAATQHDFLLLEKAVAGELVIPDFSGLRAEIERMFGVAADDSGGAVADYIPQLGRVDPDQFAVSVCTVDGQRFGLGDRDTGFCVQSCVKPVLYALALEEHGEDQVHRHVGREPSGVAFNELMLNRDGLPHNPMINSGAIMSCSLIRRDLPPADRFDHVMGTWQDLSGGVRPGYSNPTYLSERGTADRNFAIGYSMRESGAFPADTDLVETLEFYFQACSMESTADAFAVLAATLAAGGVCPTTGKRVFRADTVQKCLALMTSCGMYDFSGEWAFAIGLPAKSGVSGAIWVVIPNVMGICVWSPRLDVNGNSVRGIRFCRELVATYNFHAFDILGSARGKQDPRLQRNALQSGQLVDLYWAATKGDLAQVQRLAARGVPLNEADYDGRTALHLAASEGQADVVRYLLDRGVEKAPRDRWGNTPADDARREAHQSVAELLNAKQ